MQLIVYILFFPFLLIISLLPFRLLYGLSDFTFFIVYYLIGYRKKTVNENLRLVFPEKTDKEIESIQKKFYKHLCDMFLEMIKTMSASKSDIIKRFIFKNPEEIQRLESLNKSFIMMYGHYASYEWSVSIENYLVDFKGYGVYKRIHNVYFDKLVRRIRSKYNTTLINSKEAIPLMKKFKSQGKKIGVGFGSDQSPKLNREHHWASFMGIKVPAFTGAEMLAKTLDHSVTFLKVNKVKRGYYEAEFIPLADDATKIKDFEITDKFIKLLEAQIYQAPEYYLWTHKRWKHRDEVPEKYL